MAATVRARSHQVGLGEPSGGPRQRADQHKPESHQSGRVGLVAPVIALVAEGERAAQHHTICVVDDTSAGAKKRQSSQHAAAWLWAVWQQPSSEPPTKPAPSVPRVLCETHKSSRRPAVPSTHLSNPPPTLARLGHRRGVPPMQEWAVAAARSACHGCRTPGHSHRPRQGPLGRAECTLRARTVSARSKFSLSEPRVCFPETYIPKCMLSGLAFRRPWRQC